MKKLRFQKVWQVYFWFTVIVTVIAVVRRFRAEAEVFTGSGVVELVIWCLFSAIALVGLFGFSWQRRIGENMYWKIFSLAYALHLFVGLYFGFLSFSDYDGDAPCLLFVIAGILVLSRLPKDVAVFLYAFWSEHLWKRQGE